MASDVRTIRSLRAMGEWSDTVRRRGRRIGFVPTLGALHDGHAALVRAAARRSDDVVVSVFVNPTQFGEGEDFEAYPRMPAHDRRIAGAAGAAVMFVPSARAVYPKRPRTVVSVPSLSDTMCGARRPGHFDGVCLVVAKLLHMVRPHDLYLGRKDAQQVAVLRRMIADLSLPVTVREVATVREPDGLAMSSRNAYLTGDQRDWAPTIYRALSDARRRIRDGARQSAAIRRSIERSLSGGLGRIDYVVIVDPDTLEPVSRIDGRVLIAVAVWVGRARLIDNVTVSPRSRT